MLELASSSVHVKHAMVMASIVSGDRSVVPSGISPSKMKRINFSGRLNESIMKRPEVERFMTVSVF